MTVYIDQVVKVRITKQMRDRATQLAERKLGYRYEDGKLIKTGDDRIYNRYNYPREVRWKKIFIGEVGEEACKTVMDATGLPYSCYNDEREDEFRDDDPFDFKVGELRIDVKSSKDNRKHGLLEILKNQNLVLPIDQSAKDVIIQGFISSDEKEAWFVAWATGEELKREENLGYLHWQPGQYYLLPLKKCHAIKELGPFLKKKTGG